MDLITVTRTDGLAFTVAVRGHTLTTDMAPDEGGHDGGPNPVELLACAVGSCIATMLQQYCDEHGYTDGNVGASLTLELAADPKRIAGIVVDIELPEGIPADARAEMRGLVDGFPVPVTLRNAPQLDVEMD